MELDQTLYITALFLAIAIIQIFIIMIAFFANKYSNAGYNIVPIVAIIGLLLLVTSIIIGTNFVNALSEQKDEKEVEEFNIKVNFLQAQADHIIYEIEHTNISQEKKARLISKVYVLKNEIIKLSKYCPPSTKGEKFYPIFAEGFY